MRSESVLDGRLAFYFFSFLALSLIFLAYDEDWLSLLFSSLLIVFVFIRSASKKGVFDPASIFLLSAVPYFLSAPIDIFISRDLSVYDARSMSWLLFSGAVYVLSFYFFSNIKIGDCKSAYAFYPRFKGSLVGFLVVTFVAVYIILASLYFSLSVGSVGRADIYQAKPVIFDLYRLFAYPFFAISLWYLFLVRRFSWKSVMLPVLSLIAFLGIEVLVLGDRRIVLMFLMAIFFMLQKKVKLGYGHFTALLLVFSFFWVYGFVRNTPINIWLETIGSVNFLSVINPANMEFGAFPIVWQESLQSWDWDLNFTYLYAFIQVVPSAIFPDRPAPPSVLFVSTYYPEVASIGGGMAYNAILESIYNFSILGPIISGSALGLLYARFSCGGDKKSIIYSIFLIITFTFFMRNDFVTVLRMFIINSVVFLFFIVLFCCVRKERVLEGR